MHRKKLADHPALMGVNGTWGAHKKISKHILSIIKPQIWEESKFLEQLCAYHFLSFHKWFRWRKT